ncbi:MAG: YciI family protein [Caulobacteraceae bacterium]
MAQFAVICLDIKDGLERRMSVREAHMAYARAQPPGFIKLAGPFLDEAGAMCGSLFIFEAADRAAVDAYLAKDPYVTGGVFASVEVRPWRVTIPWS